MKTESVLGKKTKKVKKNMTEKRNKSVESEEREKQEEIRWLFITRVLLTRFHLLAETPELNNSLDR